MRTINTGLSVHASCDGISGMPGLSIRVSIVAVSSRKAPQLSEKMAVTSAGPDPPRGNPGRPWAGPGYEQGQFALAKLKSEAALPPSETVTLAVRVPNFSCQASTV